MSNTCLQLPKAQKEIIDGWKWYENKLPGLGDRFKIEVVKKIKSITENPLQYSIKGKYHETLTDDFPYLIVYKFDKRLKIIYIVSVFHTSRHPKRKNR